MWIEWLTNVKDFISCVQYFILVMTRTLVQAPLKCRVSSVLNKDRVLYGAQNMLSDDISSCWNSDQGSSQFIILDFQRQVHTEQIHLLFQGGFVGQDAVLLVRTKEEPIQWKELQPFEPVNDNSMQIFPCDAKYVTALKIVFRNSSDFYGRVIVYQLDVRGREVYE